MHANGKCSLLKEKEADRQRPKSVGLYRARNSVCPNDIFGVKVINHQQCKKRRRVEKKKFSLEDLSAIVDVIEDLKGEELLREVQKIVSVLRKIEKKKKKIKKTAVRSPFSRKLLSVDLDQCDTDNCIEKGATADMEDKETNEDAGKEEKRDDIEDIDDSDFDEGDDIGDEDLLDSEELAELLANKDLPEKISTMNDVLDDLESLFELNLHDIDEDLYVSAIQSLIVYIYSVEEMQETPHSKQSSADSVLLQKLSERMKEMKKTYLSQVTHFEMFFSNSWERFKEIIEDKIYLEKSNKESVDKINEFAFNFHYATEIERIIRRRAIEDEIEIIEEFKDDLGLMQQVYDHLGFGEETQDEGYFSRMLSGMVSEDEDDEDTHKNRRLLSIADPDSEGYCSKDDMDCEGPTESVSIQKDAAKRLTDLDICEKLLQRTQQIGQFHLKEDQLAVLTGTAKVQYIKTFIQKLKESRQIVGDYQEHLKKIADPQDYNKCYRMLEKDLGKLQSQAANTNWLKHLASLIASNNKEILSELTDMLHDQNEDIDRDSPTFRKRNLLSVMDDEFCEKDDIECRERSSLSDDLKHAQQYSDKEQAVENLKQELRDSYEEMRVSDENKEDKKSNLLRCQELLTKSEQELKKFQQNSSKNKDLKKMKPKQKMKIIRQFMDQMTVTKTLFDDHREITTNLNDQYEREFCQPILKVCCSNQ